ncbi:hypothetical protein Bca52824_015475 [Brassica carinata]|uniref:TIR domain-containing protein n=1 Tax=Brassica carinata TaxID=52824 RepID=A0A8X7W398_BRACI|nr:hypothetical protein Bca52824_015475 [Brassica carinata]
MALHPSSTPLNWIHDVFMSFHGADVHTTFLSHVLKEFKRRGIDTFIDNNIERSKSIGPKLIEGIRGSRVATALLSKNYASFTWCLNELVEIAVCRREFGQTVMPVFYDVDPSDVKKQAGEFGEVFENTCNGKTEEDTRRWREALAEVATIAGAHSRNWCSEAEMIEKIADDVSNVLNDSVPSKYFESLIGIGAHMEKMRSLLSLECDEVRMAHGIHHIYKVDYPIDEEALQIFCTYAFGQNSPKDGFEELAVEVTNLSGKLPLGLRILEDFLGKTFEDLSHGLGILAERSLISLDFFIDAREICRVLKIETKGSESLVGMDLDLSEINKEFNISKKTFKRMCSLQFLRFYTRSDDNGDGRLHSPQNLKYLSPELRLLHWDYFPATCLPSTFVTEFLVELNLRNSKLTKLWEGVQPLQNLKCVDLSHSSDLKELPDLSTATNLVSLDLSYCTSLVELHSSVGNATNLSELNIEDCSNLAEIPFSVENIPNLKIFLAGCSSLVKLPSWIWNITSLNTFNLQNFSSCVQSPLKVE